MERINNISIDFISCTQFVSGMPAEISLINITVETLVPGDITFFGISTDPALPSIIEYQFN